MQTGANFVGSWVLHSAILADSVSQDTAKAGAVLYSHKCCSTDIGHVHQEESLTHTPAAYWRSYEPRSPISSIGDLLDFVGEVAAESESLVWRGVRDHRWALHSSLYRYALGRSAKPPTERKLRDFEIEVLGAAARWGIDRAPSPLSGLELLAKLQHTGTPTRLIDVTHNPLVAAWFATDITKRGATDGDGRIFAVDYSGLELRDDLGSRPGWLTKGSQLGQEFELGGVFVWTPPPIDARMAAQSGAFLVGPVPSTASGGKWYNAEDTTYSSGSDTGRYTADQVRELTSVSVRAYRTMRRSERYRRNPLVSVRVAKSAKATLRKDLSSMFNLQQELLFPDPFGLAKEFRN